MILLCFTVMRFCKQNNLDTNLFKCWIWIRIANLNYFQFVKKENFLSFPTTEHCLGLRKVHRDPSPRGIVNLC
jgi:hypothetical protein